MQSMNQLQRIPKILQVLSTEVGKAKDDRKNISTRVTTESNKLEKLNILIQNINQTVHRNIADLMSTPIRPFYFREGDELHEILK